MNRKQRRARERETSPDASDRVAKKVAQFNKMPSQCSACDSPFDKKDRDMVSNWSVVVRQEVVRLFCPTCIQKTQEVLGENKSLVDACSSKSD
jgi:Zn finger protein HypA/HybF involved in hydrogenase expression